MPLRDRARRALDKEARRGFTGYPAATVAFYGPDNRKATKVAVGIVAGERDEPDPLERWYTEGDIRKDPEVMKQVPDFVRHHRVKSVLMTDGILGCPHEEGIDYPEGESCPKCPYWRDRPRPTDAGPAPGDPASSAPAVGVGWYSEEQWRLLRERADDPEALDDSYREWLEGAENALAELWRAGLNPSKIVVDVGELEAWCRPPV